MDWRGLIRIGKYFDLLGIETPQSHLIHMDWGRTEHGLRRRQTARPRCRRGFVQLAGYKTGPWEKGIGPITTLFFSIFFYFYF
jgi:hypothetical protein